MPSLSHLTNEELINQLTLREDLTDLEHELLDRLIRTQDAVTELEDDILACGHASQEEETVDGNT